MLKYHINAIHTEKSLKIQKKSENNTYNLLIKYLTNITREYRIKFDCLNGTCAKIDFYYIKNNIHFLIENDEHQHKSYELKSEIKRMNDSNFVLKKLNLMQPIVWIRYNPDCFKINNETQKITKEQRIKKIIDFINSFTNDYVPDLSIFYFYYNIIEDDNKNKKLCIFDDLDYPEEIKSIVKIIY